MDGIEGGASVFVEYISIRILPGSTLLSDWQFFRYEFSGEDR